MRYANKISFFRIVAIPFFIAAIFTYTPQKPYLRFIALVIFSLAIISDALDGLVARINKEKTALGPIIDPVADKLLLISAYLVLFLKGDSFGNIVLPLWIVLLVMVRDVIILSGTFLIFIVRSHVEIIPTSWGKLTTFFQMATIVSVLLQFKFSYLFWLTVALLTTISGLDYVRRGIKLFNCEQER